MIIKPLYDNVKQVVVLSDSLSVPSKFEVDLNEAESKNKAAKGFRTLFLRYSEGLNLTYEMFHDAGEYNGQQFHEFRKGRLRVYCVIDPDNGSVILLSHIQMKSTRKTQTSDLIEAYSTLQQYKDVSSALELK